TETDLSVRIRLPAKTITAGGALEGTLVITKHSGGPVALSVANGCWPWFAVVLTNDGVPAIGGFDDACGPTPTTLHRGTNRLPFTLLGFYTGGCLTDKPTPALPLCTASGVRPLPPGKYHAVLLGNLPVPIAHPVA